MMPSIASKTVESVACISLHKYLEISIHKKTGHTKRSIYRITLLYLQNIGKDTSTEET